jgi:hypothetical protein
MVCLVRTWSILCSKYCPHHRGVCLISDFHHEVGENCALPDYYTVTSDNLYWLWDNLLVPSARDFFLILTVTMVLIVGPKMSIRSYHYLINNKPKGCSSHSAPHLHKTDLLMFWGKSLGLCTTHKAMWALCRVFEC